MWVIKISSSGVLQWQKCLGGSGVEAANSVGQTNDGGYIVAGYTNSIDGDVTGYHGGYYDAWVIKLTGTGSIDWAKTFGGSSWDYAVSVQQTYDGGYIVGTQSTSNDGDITGHHGDTTHDDLWVVKLSSSDSMEWERSLGGSNTEYCGATIQIRDSGYIVAGGTWSGDGDVTGHIGLPPDGLDGWVVKLANSGAIQWNKCIYICGADMVSALSQTADGGYLIAGGTCTNIVGNGSALYGKLSGTGSIEWMESYGGSDIVGPDLFYSLAFTNDGSAIAAGYTHNNDEDVSGNHGQDDFWVVKFGWHSKVEDVYSNASLVIAPSPTNHYINIAGPDMINQIAITNIMGQLIFTNSFNTEKVQIDVSAFPTGMYFIKVNGTETGRFIKE